MRVLFLKLFSFKKIDHKLFFSTLSLLGVALVLFLVPQYTYAGLGDFMCKLSPACSAVKWVTGWGVGEVFEWIIEAVAKVVFAQLLAMFQLGLYLCKGAIWLQDKFLSSYDVANNWMKIRDLALSLFGLSILAIAFMNVLKINIESWGVSKLIPRLIFGAIMVVFSKFICFSVINFTNALAGTIMDTFGINGVFDHMDTMAQQLSDADVPGLHLVFAVQILVAIAFIAFVCAFVALLVRAVMIVFLVVLSPLAFAMYVLPATEKLFKSWWNKFLKWSFYWPVFILIISIGAGFMGDMIGGDNNKMDLGGFLEAEDALKDFLNSFGDYIIVFVSIPLAVFLPLKLLDGAGAFLQGVITGKTGIPGAPIDPKAIREWGKARSGRVTAKKVGKIDNFTRSLFGEGKIGQFVYGGPRTALNQGLRDDMTKGALSPKQMLAYARGELNKEAMSANSLRWLTDWEKAGGNREIAIESLIKEGKLDHDTAANPFVEKYMLGRTDNIKDYNDAVKASNLYHLQREDKGVDENGNRMLEYKSIDLMGASGQLDKMHPDITKFRSDQLVGISDAKALEIGRCKTLGASAVRLADHMEHLAGTKVDPRGAVTMDVNLTETEKRTLQQKANIIRTEFRNQSASGGGTGTGGGVGRGAPGVAASRQRAIDEMNERL